MGGNTPSQQSSMDREVPTLAVPLTTETSEPSGQQIRTDGIPQ